MKNEVVLSASPDWEALKKEVPEIAARRLGSILVNLDGIEERVFAWRGMAALLIEERQLYRFVVDEEVGDYFTSFDRYLKVTCVQSWSNIRKAMQAVKELKDVPFNDLLQMKRCNIQQLKGVSSSVRMLPEVIEAAKNLPEKALVEKLNSEHAQHLEISQPIVMAPTGDVDEFERAVEMITLLDDCHSRTEALKAIGVRIIQDCAVEYEEYRKTQHKAGA